MKTINIALAADNKFAVLAATLLKSVEIAHKDEDIFIRAFLISNNISKKNMCATMRRERAKSSQPLDLVVVQYAPVKRSVVGSGPILWPGKSLPRRYRMKDVFPTLYCPTKRTCGLAANKWKDWEQRQCEFHEHERERRT